MYANCFGIKQAKDLEKVEAFLKENNIDYTKDHPLFLFEDAEAKFRITELYNLKDENDNTIEVTNELVLDLARHINALGGDYIDYDYLDDQVREWAKEHNYCLA